MSLRRQEFTLDAKKIEMEKIIKDNEDQAEVYRAEAELSHVTRELRSVQYKIYGWRFCERLYGGKDRMLEKLLALKRRVLQLENEEIDLQKTLDNYDHDVHRRKQKIQELQGLLSSGDVGYVPTPEEIEKANEKLLDVYREAGHAEMNLPRVEKNLSEAKAELEMLEASWEKAKKHTDDQVYESPGHEVNDRSKEYSEAHGVDYKTAMAKVLAGDPILGFAYMGK